MSPLVVQIIEELLNLGLLKGWRMCRDPAKGMMFFYMDGQLMAGLSDRCVMSHPDPGLFVEQALCIHGPYSAKKAQEEETRLSNLERRMSAAEKLVNEAHQQAAYAAFRANSVEFFGPSGSVMVSHEEAIDWDDSLTYIRAGNS